MTTPKQPLNLNAELARAILAGSTSFSLLESRATIGERLRENGIGPRRPTEPARSKVDPNDPLSGLTEAERKSIEADPSLKLKERVLARVAAAEKDEQEKRAREAQIAETWARHDARDAADALADKVIRDRAAARNA